MSSAMILTMIRDLLKLDPSVPDEEIPKLLEERLKGDGYMKLLDIYVGLGEGQVGSPRRCLDCGMPESDHPYRHPFKALDQKPSSTALVLHIRERSGRESRVEVPVAKFDKLRNEIARAEALSSK